MTHCKPKINTYFALSLVVIILIGGLIYILHEFTNTRAFGLFFYLISAPLITVVTLMLLVKMMAGFKFISFGKEKIVTKYPLRGKTNLYNIEEILAWEEEKIIANKKEFRQITVAFSDKSSFTMSNHEHINYDEFVKYITKKAPKKKVKS
ncbi:hypothetical protein MM239_13000 [Belliella sp. DSM 111904]|uniref:PH domain-containing protein n=1 Tax=Belliella filtrata TaxID=2923435 RepID=A0ABS9V277_9BACT|nr:hypothetical protein [Belliella filtrata]MCH7410319.1 hypothetical protein [Belliella filtrata]